MPWLYRFARQVFRRGVRFYFMDVQTSGEENMPAHGATIYASNHPGSLMDTVVLGSEVPRTIHYLARNGLFSNPVVGGFLRAAGAIPIQRRQDLGKGAAPASGGMSNDAAFAAAHQVLADGEVVGIFPEGRNAPSRHVRDIKTGCARIGLGAESEHGFGLDLRIVPVGMNYEDRERFLSKVLVRFGPPIELRHYKEDYAKDPQATVRAVTDRLQDAMRTAATHMDQGAERLVESIDSLMGEELTEELIPSLDLRTVDERLTRRALGRGRHRDDLDARFQVRQWIADAVDYFERERPERLRLLESAIGRYRLRLKQLRLRADFSERSQTSTSARRESIGIMTYAVLLAPIALYGLIHNFVPYRITRRFALGAPEEAIVAIRSFGGGLVFFGAAYAAFASVAFHGSGSWLVTLAYLSSLPIAGVWFLRYRHNLQRMRERLLFRTLFRTKKARLRQLLIQRASLVTQINALREEYRSSLSDDEGDSSG